MQIILFFPLLISILLGFFSRYIGWLGSSVLACSGMCINVIFSILLFLFQHFFNLFIYTTLGSWIDFFLLDLFWNLTIDHMTLVMFLVVNVVSFVVHLFSVNYLSNDPHLARFMSYISFFTFFMLILICSDNFIILFLGWEGVGLCSYLLISFWYTRLNALSSALKALLINRISDFAFMCGIFLTVLLSFSFDFSCLFSLIALNVTEHCNNFSSFFF